MPEALALAHLRDRPRVLVSGFADGLTLAEALAAGASRPRSRRRDVARLEGSLALSLRVVDRVRLRALALGLRRPFDAAARAELRAVGRLVRARAVARARARMRRADRPGPDIEPVRVGALRGLRSRALAPAELAAALDAPPGCVGAPRRARWCDAGSRRLIVKEFATGLRGAVAGRVRGSPARRAWRAGIGLAALGIRAPAPLAFVERRRFGLPFASALVLEDLCPGLRADAPGTGTDAAERVDALVRLLVALHGSGATHADLTAGNVLLARGRDGLCAYLLDLEDVRVPRRLREGARVRALAQLNASLPDWIPDALRRNALRRYATWLPFRATLERVASRIARESLGRRHHWSGRDCGRRARAGLRSS